MPPPIAARATANALVNMVLLLFCVVFGCPHNLCHGQTAKLVSVMFLVSVVTNELEENRAKESKDERLDEPD